jgi:hypothetical protein
MRYKLEGRGFDLELFIDINFPTALWPWVRLSSYSASNRNEYLEGFQGVKGGGYVILTTLPSSCTECLEMWEPETSGALRTFPGLHRDCFICYVY